MNIKKSRGSLLIITIIIGFIFILSFGAITTLLITEHKKIRQKIASEKAMQIAEAGLNYYRWHLAHDSDDYTGVSNQPYYNSQGNIIGYFTIEITSAEDIRSGRVVTLCHKPGTPAERTIKVSESALSAHLAHGDYEGQCGTSQFSSTNVIAIKSTGWSVEYPSLDRIIQARYGRPSLAQFAFVTNSNVWFGDTETLSGTMHSNGGIRMDGTSNARITSLKDVYICGPEHGCNNEEKPGIWGTGQRAELWDFPIANGVDFDAITVDLDYIKAEAIDHGVYIPASGSYGYLLTFFDDGTFGVRTISKLEDPVWSYNGVEWIYDSIDYKNSSNYGSYTIPANGLIFVEDNIWVEGIIDGRATIAAARLPDGEYSDASIYITNNITYADRDGSSVLGLIAQKDILVTLYSVNSLTIDAALLAQKGHVFRNYYSNSSYPDNAIRSSIQTYGTIISNGIWTWSWVDGNGSVISGYQNTSTSYDSYLLYSPPPSFPSEDQYEFISWEDITNK